MRNIGKVLLGSVIAISTIYAAPVACTDGVFDNGNAGTSIFTNGCTIGDKLYNNFSLTGASPTNTTLTFNMTGQEFHVSLTNGTSANTTSFLNAFTWGFDISVISGPDQIVSLKDQAFYAIGTGTTGVTVTDQKTGSGGTALTCSSATGVSTGCLFTMIPGSETAGPSTLTTGKTLVHSAVTFTPGTGGILNSFEADFLQTTPSQVPEPATFGFMGAGLLALGMFRRNRISKIQ